MFSTLRKLGCFKREPKTPMGFCDGPSTWKAILACCDCSQDRYGQPYDPDNKFHEAVCMGKIKVMLHLLSKKKFNINDQDKGKRTALHFACYYGHLHLVHFLLYNDCMINALDDQKSTPLMKAVQSWETKIVSVLLDNGADPNCKDSSGETALHQAVYVDNPDIAASLLEYGAEIEETTRDGLTPLLLALRERKLLMVEYLIKNGANIHAQDNYQRTTLMYAVQCDSEDIVEQLLKKGVDHSLKDSFGWSALQYAVAGKRKVKSIILDYEDSILLSQHDFFSRNLHADFYSSGYTFKSESVISICSREEEKETSEIQQDISENIIENGIDDLPEASKKYDNIEEQKELGLDTVLDLKLENKNVCNKNEGYQKLEMQNTSRKPGHSYNTGNKTDKSESQVWADKCPHPELRHYSHPIYKPKPEPQQSQPDTDFSEELEEEEITESKLEIERSFDKENIGFSVSNPNGLHEMSTEALPSSCMDNDAVKKGIDHPEKKSIMEDKIQISEEEKEQKSVRTSKRPFIDAIRTCFCACFTLKRNDSPLHKK
ncbi:POTE ankyrin domain family member A-like isoform X2 [Mastomys coucha]|uniref:POTE ankyrin domain family member A-like isoform X2 n=1 Tax=Mastomys coucha TaxID=35658 RepID=UPI001261E6AB|nr:POTE ankyrin domain family member A-like isoform X2 [Mastomys coucha]